MNEQAQAQAPTNRKEVPRRAGQDVRGIAR
jgi:hypothetical protein